MKQGSAPYIYDSAMEDMIIPIPRQRKLNVAARGLVIHNWQGSGDVANLGH